MSKLNESSNELFPSESDDKRIDKVGGHIFRRMFFIERRGSNSHSPYKRTRILKFESLEERLALNTAPILQGFPDIVYLTPGMSYHVALDGYDKDGDDLTFEVQNSNNQLFEATVLEGNRSVKFSIYQEQTENMKDWQYVGDIIFELFEDEAPITTARIMEIINGTPLVNDAGQYIDKSGNVVSSPVIVSYDGVAIHRVLDGFMFQGGDVRYGTGYGGTGVKYENEISNLLQHSGRGIVSTANSGIVDGKGTNDSQFFITDNATTWLDGIHNVFGFVTQGDNIREAVNAVSTATGESSVPLNALKMDNFEIFNDTENGTLRLVVPEDAQEGESEVTVWVSDGVNEPVAYTFTVKVIPELEAAPTTWPVPGSKQISTGIYDYYLDIQAGKTTTLTLPEYAVPGEVEYYATYLDEYSNELNVKITANGNELTIEAPEKGGGIARFVIGANARDNDSYTYTGLGSMAQYLTLFIVPSAPTVKLADVADTGNKGDNVTSRNNSAEGNELVFEITDVLEYATVTLYQGGTEVDATLISSTKQDNGLWTWTVKMNVSEDTITLPDGTYMFTAMQTYTPPDGSGHSAMDSLISAQLAVVINTKSPEFISPTDNDIFDAEVEKTLTIQFRTNDHVAGATKYIITSVKNDQGNTLDVPSGVELDESTGLFTWTPTSGQANDYEFTISATNGAGFSSTKTIQIVFQSGPEFEITGVTQLDEGEEFELYLQLADETYQGTVEFSLQESSLPDSVSYTLEKTSDYTAVFRWTTTESHGPATYNPVFIITDEQGNIRKKDVTLTVNEIDQAPIFTNDFERVYVLKEHEPFSLQLRATDTDAYPNEVNTLVYSFYGTRPEGIKLDPNTGLLTWTPDESCGEYSFEVTVRVTDKTGLYAEQKISLYVEETDQPPVFEDGDTTFKNNTGEDFLTQMTAKDPDYRSDPNVPINQVVYTLEGDDIPEGMSIHASTGKISWSIPADYLGDVLYDSVSVVVTAYEVLASGSLGLSSSKTIVIELTNKALLDSLTNRPDDYPSNRAQEIADRLNTMLTSDSFWMLQNNTGYEQWSGYVPVIDYGHYPFHGSLTSGGLNFHPFGVDGSGGKAPSQEKDKDKEAEDEEQKANQQKTVASVLSDPLLEETFHAHEFLTERGVENRNMPQNTADSQAQHEYVFNDDVYNDHDFYFDELHQQARFIEENIIVENAPEMEDAIDMIVALRP